MIKMTVTRTTVAKTAKTTALLSVLMMAFGLSACGGGEDHHEVKAVDKVEEAAELARANAVTPEASEPATIQAGDDYTFGGAAVTTDTADAEADATATEATDADATAEADASETETESADTQAEETAESSN